MADKIAVEVHVAESTAALERLLSKNYRAYRNMPKLVRKALSAGKKEIIAAAKASMESDPRHSYRGVRSVVYRSVIGGQLNILRKRKASSTRTGYLPARTLRPGQWGGNRRKRSGRTEQVDSYYGSDRGFILYWQNCGTKTRSISPRGVRGSLSAKGFFDSSGDRGAQKAAEVLAGFVDEITKELWEGRT